MSQFSRLQDVADNDVKVIMGEPKQVNDIEIDNNPEVKELADHLDEVEERNAATIQLMEDTDLATESRELTGHEFAILRSSLKAITGVNPFVLPAMEDGEVKASRTIAMEGFKETLKKFWNYIKSALVKFWNFLKRWWYKTFDISKRAKKRAEKLQDQADKEYGVTTENDLSFPEIKKLAIDGKVSDVPAIVKGLKELEEIVFEFIETRSCDRFNDTIDELSDAVKLGLEKIKNDADQYIKTHGADSKIPRQGIELDTGNIDKIEKALKEVFASNTSTKVDSTDFSFSNADKYKKQYGEANDDFRHSTHLPGDKWVLSVTPDKADKTHTPTLTGATGEAIKIIDIMRYSKLIVADCRYGNKLYDPDTRVKVLQPSIISRGCDSIIRMCEYVNEYRQAFERRDKFKERIIKEIDQTVNEVTSDSESAYTEVDRLIRSFANAVTGLIRRRSDFETSLCAYSMSTSVAFLNYSELSLKQYTG